MADALSRKLVKNLAMLVTHQQSLWTEMWRFDLDIVAPDVPAMLAALVVQPTLLERIKDRQSPNPSLQKVRQDVESRRTSNFSMSFVGDLWYRNCWCVPDDEEIRKLILQEAHQSPYSVHLGGTKMYKDLKMNCWWPRMKKNVGHYVAQCLICQQVKAER
ncbi:protein NYNRIN-like [Ananas comosus]|uniref:Protein NYNRIN-like n=1 Tax=Ananas comosus TaxID=4615 RepID=A0A6P5EB25_ANACO|nr:protein NYNRIN-like [Ananas comosus]